MKVLVAYMSQSGNTKKVAESIYEEINENKEIKELKGDVTGLIGHENIIHVEKRKASRDLGFVGSIKKIEKDTDRDNFLSADEAVEYGLADNIIKK